MQFPTSCSGACSGRRVEILSTFHGGLAHFPPSRCSTVRTGQELGQLSTEATSGADGVICPDYNKGVKTVPALARCAVPIRFIHLSRSRMQPLPPLVYCNPRFSVMNLHSHALPIKPIPGQAFLMCIRIIMSRQREKIKSVFALESLTEGC